LVFSEKWYPEGHAVDPLGSNLPGGEPPAAELVAHPTIDIEAATAMIGRVQFRRFMSSPQGPPASARRRPV
jgi:hypothetical protein